MTVARTLAVVLLLSAGAQADEGRDDLQDQLARLRAQVAALEAAEDPVDAARLDEIERRISILAAEIEKVRGESASDADGASAHGLGPAASKVYRSDPGSSLAGYGEVVYESVSPEREDGTPSSRTDQIDALRAILYVGHRFDDRFIFNSEIEVEHGSTGEGGEVSLEFAYVDFLWKPEIGIRGGMVLLPMGLVNELHEPTVFLGSKRNSVEQAILPTTWRENGIGLIGDVGPLTYRTYVVNGLDASGFGASGIRGGRQKGARAKAEDLAWVGRVDLTAVPGLLVGASAYVGGSGQGLQDSAGRALGVSTKIAEGHLDWRRRGVQIRALGALTWLDDVAALNEALDLTGADSIGEEQGGAYVELGYDLLVTRATTRAALIPFVRWEVLDTQRSVPAGYERDPARRLRTLTFGLVFKPIEQIVIKADFQDVHTDAKTGVDQLNVALGWAF